MKKIFFAIAAFIFTLSAEASQPWKTTVKDPNENITLCMDLYSESITVPTMEAFGPMNGYMNGNIYGVWTITSCKVVDDTHATIRLSNDLGSETQEAEITIGDDGTYTVHLKGSTVIKKVIKKKLYKISGTLKMVATGK